MNFPLPSVFNDANAVHFANLLDKHVLLPDLTLDFAGLRWVYPFGTIIIAHALRQCIQTRWNNGLRTSVTGHMVTNAPISYLKHFGFFRYIGVDAGLNVNEARGGKSYLPISLVQRAALVPASGTAVLQDQLERESDRLASVIFGRADEQAAAMMLSYCFRELMRNCFEHGRVSACSVMAQRWEGGIAEVVIADHGMGIQASLNPSHPTSSPDDALLLSLRPGISGGAHRSTGSVWDNTGFGLYVVSRLGLRYGDFSLLSSERLLSSARQSPPLQQVALRGTLVKLKINTEDAEYWPNILRNIVSEGEAEASAIPGAVKSASKGSKKSTTWDG